MNKLVLILVPFVRFIINLAGFWRSFLHNFAMIVLDLAIIIFCITYFLNAMGG